MIDKKLPILVFMIAILGGCHKIAQKENVPQGEKPEQTIQVKDMQDYLAANIGETAFDGVVFCAYDVLASTQEDNTSTLYLWVLCQEYYQENQRLEQGTGISAPVGIILQDKGLQVLEHKMPRDGQDYGKDVQAIFPQSVWPQILPSNSDEINDYNNRAETLEKQVEEKAKTYFETIN